MPTRRTVSKVKPLQGTWEPSPSPSPPPSPSQPVDLSISDADRFQLLESHASLKPSELDDVAGSGKRKSPLVVVSPEELERMVEQQRNGVEVVPTLDEDRDDEEEELLLWEEIANAVLWSIPFGFLFSGMDYAVHAQFGQDLVLKEELGRIVNMLPALFLLNFVLSRPRSKAIVRPSFLQFSLFVLCIATGVTLVQVTTNEGYLKVMRQAPSLGVLWCWSVVRMDLAWAVAALAGVGVGVWARGQAASVAWWRN